MAVYRGLVGAGVNSRLTRGSVLGSCFVGRLSGVLDLLGGGSDAAAGGWLEEDAGCAGCGTGALVPGERPLGGGSRDRDRSRGVTG